MYQEIQSLAQSSSSNEAEQLHQMEAIPQDINAPIQLNLSKILDDIDNLDSGNIIAHQLLNQFISTCYTDKDKVLIPNGMFKVVEINGVLYQINIDILASISARNKLAPEASIEQKLNARIFTTYNSKHVAEGGVNKHYKSEKVYLYNPDNSQYAQDKKADSYLLRINFSEKTKNEASKKPDASIKALIRRHQGDDIRWFTYQNGIATRMPLIPGNTLDNYIARYIKSHKAGKNIFPQAAAKILTLNLFIELAKYHLSHVHGDLNAKNILFKNIEIKDGLPTKPIIIDHDTATEIVDGKFIKGPFALIYRPMHYSLPDTLPFTFNDPPADCHIDVYSAAVLIMQLFFPQDAPYVYKKYSKINKHHNVIMEAILEKNTHQLVIKAILEKEPQKELIRKALMQSEFELAKKNCSNIDAKVISEKASADPAPKNRTVS